MKRGELWTVSGGSGLAGKPRPAVIVQGDAFAETRSVAICMFTSDNTEAPDARYLVEPTPENGLRHASHLMIDKISTVPRTRIGKKIGKLDEVSMEMVDQVLIVFLGLAD